MPKQRNRSSPSAFASISASMPSRACAAAAGLGGDGSGGREAGHHLPELLTADEVAAWLKTTRRAIYAKAERGALPGVTHVGRRLYFVRDDLLRFVEQARVPHTGDPHGGT
jgi:excisionase family DNA binding protein